MKLYEYYRTEEVKVGIGTRLTRGGDTFLLAQVSAKTLCLINLTTGDRYRDPFKVATVYAPSRSEMEQIAGHLDWTIL